jgi:gp16 family phage-associated protein
MNAAQVKQRFKREGRTVKSWATENGYSATHVYLVLNGQLKGRYGKSYEIAEKLGMNPKK